MSKFAEGGADKDSSEEVKTVVSSFSGLGMSAKAGRDTVLALASSPAAICRCRITLEVSTECKTHCSLQINGFEDDSIGEGLLHAHREITPKSRWWIASSDYGEHSSKTDIYITATMLNVEITTTFVSTFQYKTC